MFRPDSGQNFGTISGVSNGDGLGDEKVLGLFARHRGFITPEFLNQANRLDYYIAIPAMIFSAISKTA